MKDSSVILSLLKPSEFPAFGEDEGLAGPDVTSPPVLLFSFVALTLFRPTLPGAISRMSGAPGLLAILANATWWLSASKTV